MVAHLYNEPSIWTLCYVCMSKLANIGERPKKINKPNPSNTHNCTWQTYDILLRMQVVCLEFVFSNFHANKSAPQSFEYTFRSILRMNNITLLRFNARNKFLSALLTGVGLLRETVRNILFLIYTLRVQTLWSVSIRPVTKNKSSFVPITL
jgi:hypothetical protein